MAPSVVILVVDVLSIPIDETERHTPVCLHGHCPLAFAFPFEFMQSKAGAIHIAEGLGFIELRENEANPLGVDGLNPCSAARGEEQSQPLMSEGFDHYRDCNRRGYVQQPCRYKARLCMDEV